MLYRICTKYDLNTIRSKLPETVYSALLYNINILDEVYGTPRNPLTSGGYSILAETVDDLSELKSIIDYDTHPCEWAIRVPDSGNYLSALYIINDDFSIMLFLPAAIAPTAIHAELDA